MSSKDAWTVNVKSPVMSVTNAGELSNSNPKCVFYQKSVDGSVLNKRLSSPNAITSGWLIQ